MTSHPKRCNSMTTSLPSSPEPSIRTLVADGVKGVPRMGDAIRQALERIGRSASNARCAQRRKVQIPTFKLQETIKVKVPGINTPLLGAVRQGHDGAVDGTAPMRRRLES